MYPTVPAAGMSWERCLCHCCPGATNQRNVTDVSWPRIVKAALLRQDATCAFLVQQNCADENAEPRGFVHVECYRKYTHKKSLERISKAQANANSSCSDSSVSDEDDQPPPPKRPCTRSTAPQPTQKELCLFCQQQSKRKRGKPAEKLSVCESFDAAQRILDAALEKEDARILLEVQSNPDCIATDTVYHRSCYAKFTLCTTQSSRERSETASIYQQAFDVVADVIDNEILQQDGRGGIRAVTIQFLRSKFVARLEALGRPSPNYKTELVKARILNQYQGRVKFVRSSVTEPEKVIAAHLSEENYIGLMTSVIGDLGGRTEEDDEVFMVSAAPAISASPGSGTASAVLSLMNFFRDVVSHILGAAWPAIAAVYSSSSSSSSSSSVNVCVCLCMYGWGCQTCVCCCCCCYCCCCCRFSCCCF